jgi:iron complex outermembrane receptor protein
MLIKKLSRLIAFPALFFLQVVSAQDKVITGKVSNSEDGSSLSNVSVVAKGAGLGTQTDINGDFRLVVPVSVNTLVISVSVK